MSFLRDTALLEKLQGVEGCELHYNTSSPTNHLYDQPATISFVVGADEKGGEQLVHALERFHCLVIGIKNRDSKNNPKITLARCVSIIYDGFHGPRMKHLAVHQSARFTEEELEKLFSEVGQTLTPRPNSSPVDGEESIETRWTTYEVAIRDPHVRFTRANEEQITQHRAR